MRPVLVHFKRSKQLVSLRYRIPVEIRRFTLIMSQSVGGWIPEANYLAITTVVQELLSFGRSRFAAMRIGSVGRSPRMIGQ